ncbi:MAG: universal stress protein [Acidimicrobiia bacterium]|nr:universal stress protein [Acidimicrobiia bacterium]MBT8216852.1 universal stress protein [Acidimicrobiia bacterium]NNF11383.1 universal stress protein [Acidimicrobiia bacterium]NNL68696.1 universal stress protein [Acidimicrobiia bacterium]
MNVLIATAGVLPPDPVAAIIARLVDPRDQVCVVTVLEIPRSFLNEIRSEEWRPLTERNPGLDEEEDAVIARYVEERGKRLTDPVIAALHNRDIEAKPLHLEGEDKAAAIIAAAEEIDAGLVVLGATRHIFAESAWESISARVMADTRRPVLVVPGHVPSDEEPEAVE